MPDEHRAAQLGPPAPPARETAASDTCDPEGAHAAANPEPAGPAAEGAPPDAYDEHRYLRAFPDVAAAVRSGRLASGLEHYWRYGAEEKRLDKLEYRHGWPVKDSPHFPPFGIDTVFFSAPGYAMVIGWVDDLAHRLRSLSVMKHETVLGATEAIARCRRQDAERVVGAGEGRLLGLWSVFPARTDVTPGDLKLSLATMAEQRTASAAAQLVSEERFRDLALEYLANASYWGNRDVEAFAQLDRGLGDTLREVTADLARRLAGAALCRRFGPARARFTASFIVCLFGKPEFLFLQTALFAEAKGAEAFEFIFVSNSPELAERLVKEAEIAAQIYGVSLALVILPGNAGFAMANNAAAAEARSDRLLIINPDVFPRSPSWAADLAALLGSARAPSVFGAPLYYDDGSLMHAGMYLVRDEFYSFSGGRVSSRALLRVEHYGKGAAPDDASALRRRTVPAVTGAFLCADRSWFERLGGFSADYAFGHYEDADFCLRSLLAGAPAKLCSIPFWHLEGKGSIRKPAHEGGALLNRWHFTNTWAPLLEDGLLGPDPPRLAGAEQTA